tara:strand:- start:4012 stop:4524 length:513 start_codon:yes stop_codon:yes gene_type:complete
MVTLPQLEYIFSFIFFALGILCSKYYLSARKKIKWKKNLKSVGKLDYINGEYCGQCRKVISKKDCLNSYEVCGGPYEGVFPCNWNDNKGTCKASHKAFGSNPMKIDWGMEWDDNFADLNPKTGSSYWFILLCICFGISLELGTRSESIAMNWLFIIFFGSFITTFFIMNR